LIISVLNLFAAKYLHPVTVKSTQRQIGAYAIAQGQKVIYVKIFHNIFIFGLV